MPAPADTDDAAAPRKGVLGNAAPLMVSRLVVAALGWAGSIILVRELTPDEWGRYSLVFAILGILSMFTDLGVGRIALVALSKGDTERSRFAGSYIVFRAVLGILGYLLAIGVVVAAQYPGIVVQATVLAAIVVIIATPSHGYESVFQVSMRLPQVAMANVVGQAVQFVLTIVIAWGRPTLLWFIVPQIACQVVIIVMKMLMAHRIMPIKYNVDVPGWVALMKEAAPLSLGVILGTVYYRVDTVMLSQLDTFASVGNLAIAYKFADVLNLLAGAVCASVLPLMVKYWRHDDERFRAAIRQGFAVLVILAGAVLCTFLVVAEDVVSLLYGETYRVTGDATRLVVIAECIGFFVQLSFITLISVGRLRTHPLVVLVGLVANVGLNFFFIPWGSFTGAAWSTLMTETLVLALLLAAVRRHVMVDLLPARLLVPVVVAGALGTATTFGVSLAGPWIVAAAAGGVVYLLALVILDRLPIGNWRLIDTATSRNAP